MKNRLYFENLKDVGNLWFDVCLVEASYPILFTCYDEQNNPYLCACIDIEKDYAEWIVSETKLSTLKDLLTNKITIRDALCINKYVYFIQRNKKCITSKWMRCEELPDSYLPTKGEYMDSENGEFDQEIIHFTEKYTEFEKVIKKLSYVIINVPSMKWNINYKRPDFIESAYIDGNSAYMYLTKRIGKNEKYNRKAVCV